MTNDVRFLNFVFKTNRYNPTFSITTKGCNNSSLAKNNSEQTVTAPNVQNSKLSRYANFSFKNYLSIGEKIR